MIDKIRAIVSDFDSYSVKENRYYLHFRNEQRFMAARKLLRAYYCGEKYDWRGGYYTLIVRG